MRHPTFVAMEPDVSWSWFGQIFLGAISLVLATWTGGFPVSRGGTFFLLRIASQDHVVQGAELAIVTTSLMAPQPPIRIL